MDRVNELAAELEVLRTEIAELKVVEAPSDEQKARMEAILPEWDTKLAEHARMVERAEKLDAVEKAAIKTVNREVAAPNVIVRTDPFEGVENVRNMDDKGREIRDLAFRAFEDKAVTRGVSN